MPKSLFFFVIQHMWTWGFILDNKTPPGNLLENIEKLILVDDRSGSDIQDLLQRNMDQLIDGSGWGIEEECAFLKEMFIPFSNA